MCRDSFQNRPLNVEAGVNCRFFFFFHLLLRNTFYLVPKEKRKRGKEKVFGVFERFKKRGVNGTFRKVKFVEKYGVKGLRRSKWVIKKKANKFFFFFLGLRGSSGTFFENGMYFSREYIRDTKEKKYLRIDSFKGILIYLYNNFDWKPLKHLGRMLKNTLIS